MTFGLFKKKIKMEKTIRETRQVVIDQMLSGLSIPELSLILEPSAGSGNLADGIRRKYNNVIIHCIELNKELQMQLHYKSYPLMGADFFKIDPNPRYDFVIACPTYKDNIDVEHIMHMYDFLKPGGQIISLTHPAWTTHNSERQVKFRKWLEEKNYSMKMLTDNSFVEDYKTQPSMIITIKKP